jgi:hypothetical protein
MEKPLFKGLFGISPAQSLMYLGEKKREPKARGLPEGDSKKANRTSPGS